jgi:hypothetical protein
MASSRAIRSLARPITSIGVRPLLTPALMVSPMRSMAGMPRVSQKQHNQRQGRHYSVLMSFIGWSVSRSLNNQMFV